MTPSQIREFRQSLAAWYTVNQRPMPWRNTKDPYRIWVSEIMLQQTQVATVMGYYDRFIQAFPDVRTLALADLQNVLKLWEGLGYYTRARNLHRAARQLLDQGDTRVPDTPEAFLRLTGVGNYTAAAVQSIAFNHPLAVVDGNVKRVLSRVFEMEIPVNDSSVHQEFSEKAALLLDRSDPSGFNQAMMELGALECRPKNPLCQDCPVRLFCRAVAGGTVAVYPKRNRKKTVPSRHRVAGAVFHQGKLLIKKRKTDGFLGGMWEFPDAPLKRNADPEQTCISEIQKITGLTVTPFVLAARIKHVYTHFKLTLDLFLCTTQDPGIDLNGPDDIAWVTWSELENYPLHRAVHKCLPGLLQKISTVP
ncbi:MAG: A/G-specific adenine glycosylase [Pseudomonadota bacterium]